MAPALQFVGIDVSKAHLDLHLLPAQQSFRVPNTPTGFTRLLATLDPTVPACIVLEATGPYHRDLVRALLDAGHPATVINPAQSAAFRRTDHRFTKTDATDAQLLARFALQKQPPPSFVPSRAQQHLADLVARRHDLTHLLVMEKNRLAIASGRIRTSIQVIITALTTERQAIDAEIAAAIAADPALATTHARLQSVPGIGPVLAPSLLADLPELGAIPAGALSALAGVAPHLQQSGQQRGQAHIRGGRSRVRWALYLAVLTACRGTAPSLIRAHRDHLLACGKPIKVAMIATARWLLGLLHVMERDGLSWTQLRVVREFQSVQRA